MRLGTVAVECSLRFSQAVHGSCKVDFRKPVHLLTLVPLGHREGQLLRNRGYMQVTPKGHLPTWLSRKCPGPQRLDECADSHPGAISVSQILGAIGGQPDPEAEESAMAAAARPQHGLHSPKASTLSHVSGHPQGPRRGNAKAPSHPRLKLVWRHSTAQDSEGTWPRPSPRGERSGGPKMAETADPDGVTLGRP